MDGDCLKKCLVYKAVVETANDTKSNIGCCETAFKIRFSNHKLIIQQENLFYKNRTFRTHLELKGQQQRI